MAGHVLKRRRLVNPGRRRRMTPAQIRFFGTKRQKAALRRNKGFQRVLRKRTATRSISAQDRYKTGRHQARYRKRYGLGNQGSLVGRVEHAAERAIDRIEDVAEDALKGAGLSNRGRRRNRRRRNVGEILTVVPANPGRRRRSMTRTKHRRRNRRRRNWRDPRTGLSNRRRRRNRGRRHNPRVVVRYRNRRHHRRNRGRRRNPGLLTGNIGAIVGVLGGAAVTKVVTGLLPPTFMQGWTGYIATGVAAVVLGKGAGMVTRNRAFGNWVMIGGMLIVALELMGQFFPQLQLPFGLTSGTSGMGLISSSNFYVPQVNMPGSMASFVTPAGVTGAIPVVPAATSGMHGLGQQFSPGLRTMRRIGRMR